MSRVIIQNEDIVYVPFRLARVTNKNIRFACLVPKNTQAFVYKNKKRINVRCDPSCLYIAEAQTPQILIDLAMQNDATNFRCASIAFGHKDDKTIDSTFNIIQKEYSKIKLPNEINDFTDEVYNNDIKDLMTCPIKSRDLMCDFNSSFCG